MANKPLDDSGEPDIMLKAAPQGDGEQQEKVYLLPSGASITFGPDTSTEGLSVIITPELDPPDVPACLWCIFEPASPKYDPYCSLDCATASAIDDERNR